MEELTFDSIERKQIPVSIAGKKYVLMEADGAAGTAYQNALMSATRMDRKGDRFRIEGMADAEPLLLSRCLFYADDEGRVRVLRDGSPDPKWLVSLRTIQGWPNRIQTKLFDELKRISDLNITPKDKEDKEEETPEDPYVNGQDSSESPPVSQPRSSTAPRDMHDVGEREKN